MGDRRKQGISGCFGSCGRQTSSSHALACDVRFMGLLKSGVKWLGIEQAGHVGGEAAGEAQGEIARSVIFHF